MLSPKPHRSAISAMERYGLRRRIRDRSRRRFRKYCKGIVFGEFLDCGDENWVTDILLETANILEVPAYGGFKFTHAADKQTVPIGAYGILQDGILSYKMS